MAQQTTHDMLAAQIAAQLGAIEEATEARDSGEEYEDGDAQDWLYDNALGVALSYHVDIVLCTGGPDVRLECEVSKTSYGFELDRVECVGRWGSDVIRRYVDSGPVWNYAASLVETMSAE